MPDQLALMKQRLTTQQFDEVSWLEGVMHCAELAYAIAESDDQRLLAERLLQNALAARSEAYADAAMADD